MATKMIGQKILKQGSESGIVVKGLISDVSVYALPGSAIKLDNSEIIINNSGLFQITNLTKDIYIKSISVPQKTLNLFNNNPSAVMVIDYVLIIE